MKNSVFTFLLLVPSFLIAEPASTVAALPSPGFTFAKVVLVLGLIIGLILASAWFARRSGLAGFTGQTNFKVMASLPLGHKEKAVLVKVGKQYLLLGVTSGSVSYLQSYSENDNPLAHRLEENHDVRTKSGIDFATQIKKILSQGQPR